jgi:hypothetical protein
MSLKIGFIKSEAQIMIQTVDLANKSHKSIIIDMTDLKEQNLNLLFYSKNEDISSVEELINNEAKFYPVSPAESLGLEKSMFEDLNVEELIDLYTKVNARWILTNNVKTIEQLYSTITYLKDLFMNDRNSFFEELWFILKTNLATHELTIIFHDLKEPTEKQKEKGAKNTLCYSYVKGKKTPQIFDGKEKETKIMQDYEKDFIDQFSITEYDSSRGHLIATGKIDLSPILLMAKLNTFNQLQQSILISIFSGLQGDK